jgi:hypothetical protein
MVAIGATASLGLAACNKSSDSAAGAAADSNAAIALPLATGDATTPTAAPVVTALPPAPPARVARLARASDSYAYVDQAQAMSDAVGQAPPDYAFDYDGARPWVWRTSTRAVRVVEPVEGGYRYYYYQPGADYPYLVRDPRHAYGYSDGQLVSVYDDEGRLLPPQEVDQQAEWAGRYLARARALYEASLQNQRQAVIAANWAARRAQIDAARARWAEEQANQDDWRAYHDEHQAQETAYWRPERLRRVQSAQAFDRWSHDGYAGPPPPPAYYAPRPQGAVAAVGAVAGLFAVFGHHDHPPAYAPPPPSPSGPQPGHGGGQAYAPPAPSRPALPPPSIYPQGQVGAPDQAAAMARAQQARGAAVGQADSRSQQEVVDQARASRAQADAARRQQEQALGQAQAARAQADAGHRAQVEAEVRAQQAAVAQARAQQAQAAAASQQRERALASARAQQAQAQAQVAEARQAQLQARTEQAQAQRNAREAQANAARQAQIGALAQDRARQVQAAEAARQQQTAARAEAPRARPAAEAPARVVSREPPRPAVTAPAPPVKAAPPKAKPAVEDPRHPRRDADGRPPSP